MRSCVLQSLVSLAVLAISACAATGPVYSELTTTDENTGVLYVYRPAELSNAAASPGVVVDGQEYAVLPRGGYMAFELGAGAHRVDLKLSDRYSGSGGVNIHILPHASTYVLLKTWNEISGTMMTHRFMLQQKPSDLAAEAIKECKEQSPAGPRFSKSHIWSNN